jgi:hypothetical protein
VSQSIADRSRFRLVVLFASTTLAACGGGGGGGDAGTPAPSPAPAPAPSSLTLAACMQNPSGVTNTYLNSSRPRREWKAATFLNEAVVARVEYADATTTIPTRALYYKYDTTAQTVTTVGHEEFNTSGAVTLREQFVGLVNSTALGVGQSEAKTYTVKTPLPTGTADRTETSTVTYEANEVVTLPGGRLDTCRVRNVLANAAGTQVSVETLHLSPGLGFVKSYYKPTLSSFVDRNQTYLTELVASTGALSLQAANADTAPPLSQCSALAPNLNLVLSASTSSEANSAVRQTKAATFNGMQSIAIERYNAATNNKSQVSYMDPVVGLLRYLGDDSFASDGTLVETRNRTGRPDLRSTPPTNSMTYTETYTDLFPAGGRTSSSNDTFTFEGYAKVTTPAGTFDTCKVRFNYQNGLVETYYHAPNLHWVRLDSTQAGVRTTRELISK